EEVTPNRPGELLTRILVDRSVKRFLHRLRDKRGRVGEYRLKNPHRLAISRKVRLRKPFDRAEPDPSISPDRAFECDLLAARQHDRPPFGFEIETDHRHVGKNADIRHRRELLPRLLLEFRHRLFEACFENGSDAGLGTPDAFLHRLDTGFRRGSFMPGRTRKRTVPKLAKVMARLRFVVRDLEAVEKRL